MVAPVPPPSGTSSLPSCSVCSGGLSRLNCPSEIREGTDGGTGSLDVSGGGTIVDGYLLGHRRFNSGFNRGWGCWFSLGPRWSGVPAWVSASGRVGGDRVTEGYIARRRGIDNRLRWSILAIFPAQQLEHSRCAALHSQTARGSAPQVANLVHWQHLRASAVLWRRRWRGLVESIDRSVDRLLRMVVSGLGPSSESRVEWRPRCCAAATPRKCDHIGTSLSMPRPKKWARYVKNSSKTTDCWMTVNTTINTMKWTARPRKNPSKMLSDGPATALCRRSSWSEGCVCVCVCACARVCVNSFSENIECRAGPKSK